MRRIVIAIGIAAALSSGPASAHHSGAMFDRSKTITLTGVVKQYQFANPHSWIDLAVMGQDGKETLWGIEAQTPTIMRRLGVTPSVLKTGDKVTLRTHPLRDGRSGGSFVDITLADGKLVGSTPTRDYGLSAKRGPDDNQGSGPQ